MSLEGEGDRGASCTGSSNGDTVTFRGKRFAVRGQALSIMTDCVLTRPQSDCVGVSRRRDASTDANAAGNAIGVLLESDLASHLRGDDGLNRTNVSDDSSRC